MSALLTAINPGILLVVAGLAGAFVTHRTIRQAVMVATPLIGLVLLATAEQDVTLASAQVLGLELILYRVDSLSFIFALGFLLVAVLNAIYAQHEDDRLQDGLSLAYAGAATAGCLAGDLMTLFIFWELTALTSVFLIFRAGTQAAYNAGMRYLGVQVLSGVLLLDGVAYLHAKAGTTDLAAFQGMEEPGALLIFIALGIKAAFPLLHNWLQDAYPKATVTGAVVLSAFTTKLAVYAFARMFPGTESLIWIGAAMAVFPILFALLANDLRTVLAYSLNAQLGFMICAVGVGTPLALNGAAAHAFVCIFYTSLLFMGMGAVLHRTGTAKASELGGLYRTMPWTTLFCLIGAASISAVPLFSGFVGKSLIMSALAKEGHLVAWLMLLFAAAGVLIHTAIKVPYSAFFGADSGKRVAEAPFSMLLAMGLTAGICVFVGLPLASGAGYGWLYALLPDPGVALGYSPYTAAHILEQVQLLVLGTLGFLLLKRFGLYPQARPITVLDTDWVYRRLGYSLVIWLGAVWHKVGPAMTAAAGQVSAGAYDRIEAAFSPRGILARGPLTGSAAMWTAVLLGVALLLSFGAVTLN